MRGTDEVGLSFGKVGLATDKVDLSKNAITAIDKTRFINR